MPHILHPTKIIKRHFLNKNLHLKLLNSVIKTPSCWQKLRRTSIKIYVPLSATKNSQFLQIIFFSPFLNIFFFHFKMIVLKIYANERQIWVKQIRVKVSHRFCSITAEIAFFHQFFVTYWAFSFDLFSLLISFHRVSFISLYFFWLSFLSLTKPPYPLSTFNYIHPFRPWFKHLREQEGLKRRKLV